MQLKASEFGSSLLCQLQLVSLCEFASPPTQRAHIQYVSALDLIFSHLITL